MELIVLASALRREEITEDDILHAIDLVMFTSPMEDPVLGPWEMYVGPDTNGRLIEVGIRIEGETALVFHAFCPARQQFLP